MRPWPYLLVALSACYRPAPDGACAISCAAAACPSGLSCGADQRCFATGGTQCSGSAMPDTSGPTADAPLDGIPGVCDGSVHGHGMLSVCIDTNLMSVRAIGPATESTDGTGSPIACTAILRPATGPEVCVIAAQNLSVNGVLRATGTRALLLLGVQGLTVPGTAQIDVSSYAGSSGAGAPLMCVTPAEPGVSRSGGGAGGAGGGAGGAYGGGGGAGGPSAGNPGGGASSTIPLVSVTGGCPGAPGGNAGTINGGERGAGGGAVYLMSDATITVAGLIDASGAGGYAVAGTYAGGGGGGAGGFIGLDAVTYQLGAATMFTIGGGGSSGGADTGSGVPGLTAGGPAPTGEADPMNGAGIGAEGNPGDGNTGGPGMVEGAGAAAGGGGGGGGGGYIAIWNIAAIGTISTSIAPLPVDMP